MAKSHLGSRSKAGTGLHTFAEGPKATPYVTNSAIGDSPRFNAKGRKSTSINLWKIAPKMKNVVADNPAFGK